MKRRPKAVITVFFSLLSVLFIAVIFTVTEAVRVAGARAQCADITSLGCWSVFSEYENVLLEDYGLFGVDGAQGGGVFSKENLKAKLVSYMEKNTDTASGMSGKLPGILLDPWKVSADETAIDQYALLTDRGGEYYYQQAVAYMRQTAWSRALGKLEDLYRDAEGIREAESEYESSTKESAKGMKSLEKEVQSARNETASADTGTSDGSIVIVAEGEEAETLRRAQEEGEKKNPLEKIKSLQSRGILELVCGRGKVSSKSLDSGELYSKRPASRGVLALDTPYGGHVDNLLFCEYLIDHFRNYSDRFDSKVLSYQLEYLIAGKRSDEANLKTIARRLLAIREGLNYAFLLADKTCSLEATALASLILGWTGRPALIATIKHALLLAWAYGESLFDVRILLHGGRVPLAKTRDNWNVPLSSLINLESDLKRADQAARGPSSGLQYEDYLRLLLDMQGRPVLQKRSLDLIELNIRALDGYSAFRVDNCVIGLTCKVRWTIPAVYSRVAGALAGTSLPGFRVLVEGGFSYS